MIEMLAMLGFSAAVCLLLSKARAGDGKPYGVRRMLLLWIGVAALIVVFNLGSVAREFGAGEKVAERIQVGIFVTGFLGLPILNLLTKGNRANEDDHPTSGSE